MDDDANDDDGYKTADGTPWSELPKEQIRSIVANGKKEDKAAYESLKEAGYIFDINDL